MPSFFTKKLGFFLLSALFVILVFLSYVAYKFSGGEEGAAVNANQNSSILERIEVTGAFHSNSSTASSLVSPEADNNTRVASADKQLQDSIVYRDWLSKHGVARVGGTDYDTYGRDTLKQLALNGDESAVFEAGQRHWREQGFEVAVSFYIDAAIRGSTVALGSLSGSIFAQGYMNATDLVVKKQLAIEVLALNEAAAMRGNPRYRAFDNRSNYRAFKSDNIMFSDADSLAIKERAQQIYNELQKARDDLGLGLFDNSIPDSVKQLFDEANKSSKRFGE